MVDKTAIGKNVEPNELLCRRNKTPKIMVVKSFLTYDQLMTAAHTLETLRSLAQVRAGGQLELNIANITDVMRSRLNNPL